MPSDPRTAAALAALAAPRERFQSAVVATLEEVRVYLDTHRSAADDRLGILAAELGPIGTRYIDVSRLAGFVAAEPGIAAGSRAVLERALGVLREVASGGDDGFVVNLPAGESLYGFTTDRFAELGRAMGAARVVDAARNGRYRPADHDRWLARFPFASWSQAERAVAPPLVVEVDGADLRPAGLAEFLDGAARIVLVVRGETSPAPLVRLVTPRTFVAQTADESMVARLAACDGPGIVAVMPERAARFVHDPGAGPALAARLTVSEIPSPDHRKRTGAFTVAQQNEELGQLRALQSAATAVPAPTALTAESGPSADPVDKLAAWLLQQADLSGV
jgi:hypothetical protein